MYKFAGVTTIVATKYFDTKDMRTLYELGYANFGENRVQNLLSKKQELSGLDIKWHLIGPLQTNKVKQIINEIDYLHTLDRISLAESIQKYANNPLNCFIQVNLTKEEQKNGILLENLDDFINEIKKYDKINVIGLMAMGKLDDDIMTDHVFAKLNELKQKYHLTATSMGMSHDYKIALKHGANFLRIGSAFKEIIKEHENGIIR